MEKTISSKLCELRKRSGLTQDAIAEKFGVSPQAVSKWENGLACPDIMLLPKIASFYGITVDELFNSDSFENVSVNDKEEKKDKETEPPKKPVDMSKMYLYVFVDSKYGDDVKVRVPLVLAREILYTGKSISTAFGVDLSAINIDDIFQCVNNGFLGEIANVKTQNGDEVRVVVE